MPNWCLNRLTIEHEDRAKVMEFAYAYKEGKACDHYLPVPRDESGELITDEKHPDYWYNWCVNNWGTKWDIGSENGEMHGLHPTVVGNQATMSFDSAWAPPIGLYDRLQLLGFKVEASYFEPGIGFAGRWIDGEDQYYEAAGSYQDFPQDLIEEYNMDEFYEDTEASA